MKEANYNHLKLENFPSLNSDASGSAAKRRRQLFYSNAENAQPDEGGFMSANNPASFVTPRRPSSLPSFQRTPTERPPLSHLTNQSCTPNGINSTPHRGTPTERPPLSHLTNQSCTPNGINSTPHRGSVFNINTNLSPNYPQPMSSFNNHSSSFTGTIFNKNAPRTPTERETLSDLTNQSCTPNGYSIKRNAQTSITHRPSPSNLTHHSLRSSDSDRLQ